MPHRDPAAAKAYFARRYREVKAAAERDIPGQPCERCGKPATLHRKDSGGYERSRFCRKDRSFAMPPEARHRRGVRGGTASAQVFPQVMSKRHGPQWRKWMGKRRGDGLRGKPMSPAKQEAWGAATQKRYRGSSDFMRVVAFAQKPRTALEWLVIEDEAREDDAKALARRMMARRGGRRPDYTLADVRGYMKAGMPPKAIAEKIHRSVPWARQLVDRINELDVEGKTKVSP